MMDFQWKGAEDEERSCLINWKKVSDHCTEMRGDWPRKLEEECPNPNI